MKYKKPPIDRRDDLSLNTTDYKAYSEDNEPREFKDIETGVACYITIPKDFERLSVTYKWISKSEKEKPERKIIISFYFDGSDKMSSFEAEDPYKNFEELMESKHYYFYKYYATFPEFSDLYVGLQVFDLQQEEKPVNKTAVLTS